MTTKVVQSSATANDQSWSACLAAAPDGRLFTGSTRSPGSGSWPDPFARCFDTGDEVVAVDCAQPHDVEVFGRFNPIGGLEALPHREIPVLLAQCTDLIRDKVSSADPTFGGRLAIRAQPLLPGGDTTWSNRTRADAPRW